MRERGRSFAERGYVVIALQRADFDHLAAEIDGELERRDLDESMRERVRSFAERGYVVIDLERSDFDHLAAEIDRELEDEFAAVGNRVQDAWAYVPAVREIAIDNTVLTTLEALY